MIRGKVREADGALNPGQGLGRELPDDVQVPVEKVPGRFANVVADIIDKMRLIKLITVDHQNLIVHVPFIPDPGPHIIDSYDPRQGFGEHAGSTEKFS